MLALKRSSFASESSRRRDEEARAQPRAPDRLGELLRENVPGPVLVLVVEEVLLDAVEDDEDVSSELRGACLERVCERRSRLGLPAACDTAAFESGRRIVLPVVEDDDRVAAPALDAAASCATPARSTELFPTPVSP